jgi:hypothetical protein
MHTMLDREAFIDLCCNRGAGKSQRRGTKFEAIRRRTPVLNVELPVVPAFGSLGDLEMIVFNMGRSK